jgi:glutathione S-transferase
MSLQIYGTSRSRAFRVLWAATELELDFEHVPRAGNLFGTDESYRVINPKGTVPAIRDDGFVLTESLAINLYLAEKQGRLWPGSIQDRARVLQWTLWVATSIEEAFMRWGAQNYFLPEDRRSEAEAQAAARDLQAPLDELEAHLSKSEWLVGESFSIADLNVASVIALLRRFEREKRPHFIEWLERCRARPAFRTAAKLP